MVGVNTFPDRRARIDVLKVDAASVRGMQIEKLKRLRAERNEAKTQAALEALTEGAKGRANLLGLSVDAARAKATVGEIGALEAVWKRSSAAMSRNPGDPGIYSRHPGVNRQDRSRA